MGTTCNDMKPKKTMELYDLKPSVLNILFCLGVGVKLNSFEFIPLKKRLFGCERMESDAFQ